MESLPSSLRKTASGLGGEAAFQKLEAEAKAADKECTTAVKDEERAAAAVTLGLRAFLLFAPRINANDRTEIIPEIIPVARKSHRLASRLEPWLESRLVFGCINAEFYD